MKNRVHYGEFTLDYWLEQLISGGIVLPEYQRSFVWTKEQIINFIKSIGKDEFIPAHLQSSVFKLSKDLIDSIHEEGIVAYTS